MNMEKVIFVDEMQELSKRFILQKSEENEKCWLIIDKLNNIVYSFIEKEYFDTTKISYLTEEQENMNYADKMHLKYEMEYWFLYMHPELAYPDSEFTFKPFENLEDGYYKITHNVPPIFEVIVKSEGTYHELAEYLTKLADLCNKKDLIIL